MPTSEITKSKYI